MNISIDCGAGFTKYVSGRNRGSFPSVISLESDTTRGFSALGLQENHDLVFEFLGKRWAVGDAVASHGHIPVRTPHSGRIGTEFYKVLIAAAMIEGMKHSGEVQAVVSLPPGFYWEKDELIRAIAGEYYIKIGNRELNYYMPEENILVIPEGFGTAAMYALNKDGTIQKHPTNRVDLFAQHIGVADVGTFSSDLLELNKVKIMRNGTTSIPFALNSLHDRVIEMVSKQGRIISGAEADEILRKGFYMKGGRKINIEHRIEAWGAELAATIAGTIRQRWDNGDIVDTIIITGGGADFVAPVLQRDFPHAVVFNDSKFDTWMSNVEGAHRYLLFRQGYGA